MRWLKSAVQYILSVKIVAVGARYIMRYCGPLLEKRYRFCLYSGERQIARDIKDIRCDHIARYELVVRSLASIYSKTGLLFGLDIFSGVGYGTHIISERLSCTMMGIEGSSRAVRFAQRYYHSPSVLFVQKIFPFYLPQGVFDFIVCIESLEHVKEYDLLLENMAQGLKDGGHLFLSTPNEKALPLKSFKDSINYHHRHFTAEEIRESCGRYGLEIVSSFGQDLYDLSKGLLTGLPEKDMVIQEGKEGQIIIFEIRKTGSKTVCRSKIKTSV